MSVFTVYLFDALEIEFSEAGMLEAFLERYHSGMLRRRMIVGKFHFTRCPADTTKK